MRRRKRQPFIDKFYNFVFICGFVIGIITIPRWIDAIEEVSNFGRFCNKVKNEIVWQYGKRRYPDWAVRLATLDKERWSE